MRPRISVIVLILVSAVLFGCQGNPVTPGTATPDSAVTPDIQSTASSHYLLGYSTIIVDTGSMTAEVLPVRTTDLHYNLTRIFNDTMAMSVAPQPSQSDPSSGYFVLDITLTHPFPGKPVLTAFDVKGILMTPGTYVIGANICAGLDETRLVNADAYTRWWNPTEFWEPGFFGYTQGNFGGTPALELTATVNGYKLFADGLGPEENIEKLVNIPLGGPEGRAVFTAGTSNTRRYEIQFPMNPGPVVKFGYAIDCSWMLPDQVPPVDIPGDFPFEANQPEAWNIEVDPVFSYVYYDTETGNGGGFLKLRFEVNDWQAMGTSNSYDDETHVFAIFAPEITEDSNNAYLDHEENGTGIFTSFDFNLHPTHTGETLLMCRLTTPGATKYPQNMAYPPAPNERIALYQSIVVDVVDPVCTTDDNNDFSDAVEMSLTDEMVDQVCFPDDESDFYTFEIPAGYELDGNIGIQCSVFGTAIEIYDSDFQLIGMEESTIDDTSPSFSVNGPSSILHPGKYYIRIHAVDADLIAPYWLNINVELEQYATHLTEADTDDLFFIPKDVYIADDYNNYIVAIGDPGLRLYSLSTTWLNLGSSVDIPDVTDSTFKNPLLYYTQDMGIDNDVVSLADLVPYYDPTIHASIIDPGCNIADIAMNSTALIVATDDGMDSSVNFYDIFTSPSTPEFLQSYDYDSPSHVEFFDPEGPDTHLLLTSNADENTIESYGVESTAPWEFSGSFTASNPVVDFTSQDDYIYVLDTDGSACNLTILHHDAGNLVVDGSLPFTGSYNSVSVKGNYAYITGRSRMKIINIIHPDAPSGISELPLVGTGTNMCFKGNRGYLLIENGGFEVYDLTYPPLPALVTRLEVINNPVALFESQVIYVSDTNYDNYNMVKRLYYDDDYHNSGYYIYDMQPVLIPFARMVNEPYYTMVSSPDNLAYFIKNNSDNSYSDFGPYEFPGDVTAIGLTEYISSSSSHFFYIAEDNGNLNIGELPPDSAPEFLSVMSVAYNINEILIDEGLNTDLVEERRLYAITDIGTVEIFNIDDPSDPQHVGTYTPSAAPLGMTASYKYLYLACGSVFEIVDVSDPAMPEFKGSVALGGDYAHVATDGQYAYLAGSSTSDVGPTKCTIWPPDNPEVVETVTDWEFGGCRDMCKNNTGPVYLATDRGVRVYWLY